MNQVVVDASVALAWCFQDEMNEYADRVLISLEGKKILVPAVWSSEIVNGLLSGERRKRLPQPEIRKFTTLLKSLSLVQDLRPISDAINDIFPLARAHGLSAYDAAYLELSLRHGVPLATLDNKLQKAARKAGVKLAFSET